MQAWVDNKQWLYNPSLSLIPNCQNSKIKKRLNHSLISQIDKELLSKKEKVQRTFSKEDRNIKNNSAQYAYLHSKLVSRRKGKKIPRHLFPNADS